METHVLLLPGDNPENDAARIEQLLRLGAHAIMAEEEAGAEGQGQQGAAEEKGMAAEGIEQVGTWAALRKLFFGPLLWQRGSPGRAPTPHTVSVPLSNGCCL
jgi:hypothetical protein